MTVQRFASRLVTTLLVSGASVALVPFASAQIITRPQQPLSDVDCPQGVAFGVIYVGANCTSDGTRTTTPTTGTATPSGGNVIANGQWQVNFNGNLKTDGIPFSTVGGQTFTIDPTNVFDPTAVVANVTSSYTGQLNNLTLPNVFNVNNVGYFNQYLNPTTTVNSINVNINDGDAFDSVTQNEYTFDLSSPSPTTIMGGNAVALAGKYHSDDQNDALTFGTLSGTATLRTTPGVTSAAGSGFANGASWFSPYGLTYNIVAVETTKLDETGLITPTVSVSQGINTNGSKVSNLGAGTVGTDAVNLNQLNAVVAGVNPYARINSTGAAAVASGSEAVAVGANTISAGQGSFAGGASAGAYGTRTTAIGASALAIPFQATAIGANSYAQGQNSVAIGAGAVSGDAALAIGTAAAASGSLSSAIGVESSAAGMQATAIGRGSNAAGNFATAIGASSVASQSAASAFGQNAQATGVTSTALGNSAVASHAGSTALGASATTTAANQVRVGTQATIYSLPGLITSSDAAQAGQEVVVTIDANGTLGKGTITGSALSQMGSQIGALQTGQALIDDQVAILQRGQATLFDLRSLDRKQSNRGIAAAMAMADAPFPSAPGKTSYAAKTGVYRGQVAFSGSISHRLKTSSPFAFTASVSHAGKGDTGVTAGLAGEF